MAISNTSSGFRPGVCTSTTRPEAPFNGQVIYETDTKQTLVWQGTAWVMLTDADQPPGMQLVKTQTVGTGVSSVTVTDAFNADYDAYKITYTGGITSVASDMRFYFGSSPAANGYYMTQINTRYDSGAIASNPVNNQGEWHFVGGGDGSGCFISLEVFNPFNSGRNKYMTYQGFPASLFSVIGTGISVNQLSYTSFTFDPFGTNTMTGGTIRVYGYRN